MIIMIDKKKKDRILRKTMLLCYKIERIVRLIWKQQRKGKGWLEMELLTKEEKMGIVKKRKSGLVGEIWEGGVVKLTC